MPALHKLLQLRQSSQNFYIDLDLFLLSLDFVIFTHHVLDDRAQLHYLLLHRYHEAVHLSKNLIFICTVPNYLAGLGIPSVEVILHQPHLFDSPPLGHRWHQRDVREQVDLRAVSNEVRLRRLRHAVFL